MGPLQANSTTHNVPLKQGIIPSQEALQMLASTNPPAKHCDGKHMLGREAQEPASSSSSCLVTKAGWGVRRRAERQEGNRRKRRRMGGGGQQNTGVSRRARVKAWRKERRTEWAYVYETRGGWGVRQWGPSSHLALPTKAFLFHLFPRNGVSCPIGSPKKQMNGKMLPVPKICNTLKPHSEALSVYNHLKWLVIN